MTRALALCLLLGTAGCAQVRPWERETLAKPAMRLGGDPEDAARLDHTLAAREQGMPAGANRGGGCGCN